MDKLIEKNKFIKDVPILINLCHIKNYPIHYHDDLEFIWVLEGEIEVDVFYEKNSLCKDDILLIDKNEIHKISSNDNKNMVALINIDSNFWQGKYSNKFMSFIFECFEGSHLSKSDINKEKVNIIRSLLAQLILNNSKVNKEKIHQLTESLLLNLVNHFTLIDYYKKQDTISNYQAERIFNIMEYIRNNYKQKISLEDISKRENIEKTYLSHMLKDLSTFTFQEHLEYNRLNASLKLLLTTDMSISQVATECGFSDSKYYYRSFHKWYKCTPASFRSQYLRELNTEKEMDTRKLDGVSNILESYASLFNNQHVNNEVDASKNNKYSTEFKQNVIDEYMSGMPVQSLFEKYDIPVSTVYHWIKQAKKNRTIDYDAFLEIKNENKKLKAEIKALKAQLSQTTDKK